MATVTKKELISRIASELCENNRLEFRDFGVFETRTRAARIAQNPKTLERVEVPAKRTVKFKMGRLMKENLCSPTTKSAETR
jgi:nucleoid DNA-binding protein